MFIFILSGDLPKMSAKYETQRELFWQPLFNAYCHCVHHEPNGRASLQKIAKVLEDEYLEELTPLSVSQDSAMTEYDAKVALGEQPSWPENDGRGCCTFLSIKIADLIWEKLDKGMLLQKDAIKEIVEETIVSFPKQINKFRDTGKYYEPIEAKELMEQGKTMVHKVSFRE